MTVDIEDLSSCDLAQYLDQCISFIRTALNQDQGVLVHCVAGVSRSATIVCAYLISQEHLTASQAIADVARRRIGINPNNGFVEQLSVFEQLHPPRRSKNRCIVS